MPPPSPLRHWARAFAVASLVHITLPDFQQAGWWLPGLVEGVGALILLWRPLRLGFALCLLGTLWPLLFMRDVLTQSMYLTWIAALGVWQPRWTLDGVRVLTALTYLIAAFHKLNAEFFSDVSCAIHAMDQIQAHWRMPDLNGAWVPYAAVGLEVAVGVAIWRRSAWMWPLGLLFHVPLTVTLAPAFGAVMLSGYVAATPARAAVRWRGIWQGGKLLLAFTFVLGAATQLLYERDLYKAAKVGLALSLFAAGVLAMIPARPRRTPRAAWLLGLAWCLHGTTPYLGLQYQHTAAMLSNLRVDPGCWNHLLVPEAVRLQDPYIRIDHASFGEPRPDKVQVLESTLWSVPALATMHRNWCIPELRPITLRGTRHGARFEIPDLCAEDWLTALPGAHLTGFQRFQKNLTRACPAACVH